MANQRKVGLVLMACLLLLAAYYLVIALGALGSLYYLASTDSDLKRGLLLRGIAALAPGTALLFCAAVGAWTDRLPRYWPVILAVPFILELWEMIHSSIISFSLYNVMESMLAGGVIAVTFVLCKKSDNIRDDEDSCKHCGYCLRGLLKPRCPECGTPFEPAQYGAGLENGVGLTVTPDSREGN